VKRSFYYGIKSAMGNNKKYKNSILKNGEDYVGVTCVFFCHDGKRRLLMHKRSQNCRDEKGRWDCGSGSMEFGESFEACVCREMKEEYGIVPKSIKLCGVANILRKNGKGRTHWVAVVFAAKVNPKQNIKTSEPHKIQEIKWFSTKRLPKPLHSRLKKHLAMVKRAGVKI